MIAFVTGRVAALSPGAAVVEVGGVGMALQCTPTTLSHLRLGEVTRVSTSMVVREESLTLFGFADDDERDTFELLQTASGVGPKVAQAMLAVHRPDDLRRAVANEDLTALMKVSGVGRKGAQRIVLELKDRLGPPSGPVIATTPVLDLAGADTWRDQVRDGLIGLGWGGREAEEAVALVAAERAAAGQTGADGAGADAAGAESPPDVAALMRAALRTLSRP
jgi:Holliday junction DNA helicase RuvA